MQVAGVVDSVEAFANSVPENAAQADDSFKWQTTTMVIDEVRSGNFTGIAYTDAHQGTALVVADHLCDAQL